MKEFVSFMVELVKDALADDLISLSSELTYKLLLALFPFIIFLMSIIGYMDLKIDPLLYQLSMAIPKDAFQIILTFFNEVVYTRRASLLSGSLLISIVSASSGFNAVINGINKTYGERDTRKFLERRFISVCLVFVFALSCIINLVLLVFGDNITDFIARIFYLSRDLRYFLGYLIILSCSALLLFTVMIIYKYSLNRKITFRKIFPGALTTVILWAVTSKIFNFYITNFARYSIVYGSIGSIFILMLWLNLVSLLLLLGSEVNALLEKNTRGLGGV